MATRGTDAFGNITVTLNEFEQQLAHDVCNDWHMRAKRKGWTDHAVDSDCDEKTPDAVGAELGFCHLVNVCPTIGVYVAGGGVDAILHSGLTVDVKQTHWQYGALMVPYEAAKRGKTKADLYPLMTGVLPEFTYRGYLPAKYVFQKQKLALQLVEGKKEGELDRVELKAADGTLHICMVPYDHRVKCLTLVCDVGCEGWCRDLPE